MRICIINTHGLGDIIMTVPMLIAAAKHATALTVLCKSAMEGELVRRCLADTRVQIETDVVLLNEGGSPRSFFSLIHELRKKPIELMLPVFSMHPEKTAILSYACGARYRAGFASRFGFLNNVNLPIKSTKHKVLCNLDILTRGLRLLNQNFDSSEYAAYPSYTPDADILSQLGKRLGLGEKNRKFVAFAPGSGMEESHKRWPIDKYRELALQLGRMDIPVVVFGSYEEKNLAAAICNGIEGENCLNLAGKLTLQELFCVMNQAMALVANCNGLSHVASYVNTPIIGLFGPTNPFLTGPFTTNRYVMSQRLPCSPCYRRGFIRGCGNPLCMTEIPVATVLNVIKDKIL